jgi:hypothetical protein
VVCESEGVLHSVSFEAESCDLSFRDEGAEIVFEYLDGGAGDCI